MRMFEIYDRTILAGKRLWCRLFGHDYWAYKGEGKLTMLNSCIRCKRCHKRQMLGK